jgi:hypothetical protein
MFSPIKTILTASLLTLTTLTSVVKAQGDLSALNNITSLTGTWSSGSAGVQTGGVSSDCHLSFGLLFCRGLGWVGEFMGYLEMRIDDESTRPDHYRPSPPRHLFDDKDESCNTCHSLTATQDRG